MDNTKNKSNKGKQPRDSFKKVVARNRRAHYDYQIEDTYETGISLFGSEVKSLRDGKANITQGYAKLDDNGEVWLVDCNIAEYPWANQFNHDPLRRRKLLLKAQEIAKISHKIHDKGYTLIPLEIYFNERGMAKVLIGLGKGKREYDRRETIKERETKREVSAALKSKPASRRE